MKMFPVKPRWGYLILAAAAWVLTYLAARFVLKEIQLDPWLRVTVALLPVLPTALFIWLVVAGIRSLDELERRIHLEALAFAYPLAILLLWTLGLLQLVVQLPPEDWSYRHVWVYLPLFYFFGLALAWRRYQ
ncbi:MAG TPA: hypothetical protein PKD86_08900 [Gemmatales bacterium]|nr:hypothetical protein [Gemmatales bacterium]HMP59455.1 hypothetical protein [Gemmatales bacterium]